MPNRYWLPYAALAGCLAAFLWGSAASAQGNAPEVSPLVEESKGSAPEGPPPKEPTTKQPPKAEQPAPVSLPPAPVKEQRTADLPCDARCQATEERQKDDLIAQQAMADGTADLVSLTRWQSIIGGLGLLALFYTLYLTRESNKVAFKAAKAAEDSVAIAADTGKRQLRAYVSVNRIQITPITRHPEGQDWQISLIWQNSGQTFARCLQTNINWGSFPGEIPKDYGYPPSNIEDGNAPGVLGPTLEVFSWPVTIPAQKMKLLYAEETRIFIWGWAEYSDVFADTLRHRTEVCYEVIWNASTNAPGKTGIGQRIYGPHNGDDDNCHKKPITA